MIADIAEKKSIPIKFLESILLLLKQHNILQSKKGKGGGYYLTENPKKTSITNVVRIIGGPIALLPCASLNFYEKCGDCNEETCGLRRTMTIVRDAPLKVLEKKTLLDISDFLLA